MLLYTLLNTVTFWVILIGYLLVKDNLFQTDRFGDKLIYKFENDEYHLVKDERLSSVITSDEVRENPNSICNNDYWWK